MTTPSKVSLVFVGGSPRSGTTLIQRLLGAHSQVYAGPEFDFVPDLASLRKRMIASVETGRISPIVSKERVDDAFRSFIGGIFQEKAEAVGATVFAEKTPSNLAHFRTLCEIFPDAKFVMVLRNPYDIVASMQEVARKLRAKGEKPPPYLEDVQKSAREVARYWSAGFEAAEKFPDRVFIVHYEDAVENPDEVAGNLCRFIGLPEEAGMTDIEKAQFDATETGIAGWYTMEQLTGPIRKKSAETEGPGLTDAQKAVISRSITPRHPAMERYDMTAGRKLAGLAFLLRLKIGRKLRQLRAVFNI